MEGKRKTISKKLRFEVFKRDNFTCQYCGRMAPDVVLEIDHINPVANNGTNDIINLITSCKDCNRGKGAKVLNESEVLKKQQEQLQELNERREQLELMVKWKEELSRFNEEQVNKIENLLDEATNNIFSETGRKNCKTWIKKFGFDEVYEATEISINQYYKEKDDKAINKVFDMIPKICYSRLRDLQDPFEYKRKYIKGTLKNRVGIYNEGRLTKALREIVTTEEEYSRVYEIACYCRTWSNFWEEINDYYEGDY